MQRRTQSADRVTCAIISAGGINSHAVALGRTPANKLPIPTPHVAVLGGKGAGMPSTMQHRSLAQCSVRRDNCTSVWLIVDGHAWLTLLCELIASGAAA